MPERIQLRRTKGWQIPPSTVVVARPSKWGNRWKVGALILRDGIFEHATAADAVELFRSKQFDLMPAARAELRGKNLACWCPLSEPCHADVLLEWANR